MNDDPLHEVDVTGPYDDWLEHIRAVERQTVALPADLTQTMDLLEAQLTALAEQAPTAALKAVARLERLAALAGREAAYAAEADELSLETIGKALGLSAGKAHTRLTHTSCMVDPGGLSGPGRPGHRSRGSPYVPTAHRPLVRVCEDGDGQ
ncbi:hypothetical protein [Streptomyces sp. NPDC003710]